VPSRAVPVRIGPDASAWLTAAERSGRVGGHFRGGLNAVFGSEALVCLQSPRVPIHPWALIADLPWDEVEEGAPVAVTDGRLSVGRLVLSLERAEVVDLTFHPPASLVSLEELQERIALIEQLLAEVPDPFTSEFDKAFVRDRDRIVAEWQETGDPEVLLQLIGRGPGTTPAGDDTLVGLLAGLEVLAAVSPLATGSLLQATRDVLLVALTELRTSNPELPFRRPQTTRHKLVARARFQTSALSAQLLASAAAGRFPYALLDLQFALLDGEATAAQRVRTATDTLTIGETTGRAGLDGLAAAQSTETPRAKI